MVYALACAGVYTEVMVVRVLQEPDSHVVQQKRNQQILDALRTNEEFRDKLTDITSDVDSGGVVGSSDVTEQTDRQVPIPALQRLEHACERRESDEEVTEDHRARKVGAVVERWLAYTHETRITRLGSFSPCFCKRTHRLRQTVDSV